MWTINGLGIVSTVVMADALRRILNSVKLNPFLQANGKTLCLHIMVSLFHIASYSNAVFFAIRAVGDPDNTSYYAEAEISRILLYIFTAIVQGIMIYLIFNFEDYKTQGRHHTSNHSTGRSLMSNISEKNLGNQSNHVSANFLSF